MVRKILFAVAVCGALTALGYLIVLTPDNALVGLFRSQISENPEDKVITGPYPIEQDFKTLRSHGVTTIISLLNPAIYYEGDLLEKERALAQSHGMQLLNFPMGSILGQRFGDQYEANAAAAADAAAAANGKVYLHCYLGIHRVKNVLELLQQRQPGVLAGSYRLRQGERREADHITDQAEAAFHAGDYDQAIKLLARDEKLSRPQALLKAWSYYRKGETANARDRFMTVLSNDERNADARIGAGYSLLRLGDTASAEEQFTLALRISPDDAQAWAGLGLAHHRKGLGEKARQELQKAISLDPGNADARDVLKKLAR